MNVGSWLIEMNNLGCSNDPIEYQGKRIDVQQFSYDTDYSIGVGGIRIRYYDGFKRKWVDGTLLTMLKERRKPTRKKRKPNLTASNVITAIDCGLESDNRHSESAQTIWDSIRKFIPAEKRLDAAKGLSHALSIDWKDYIKHVYGFEEEN